MAEYLASATWDFATLELGVNMTDHATTEEFKQLACALIDTIHEGNPSRLIFAIDIYPNRADFLLDRNHLSARNNAPFREVILHHVAAKNHPMLHHIPADSIFREIAGLNADLLHPSDDEHISMGEHLADSLSSYFPA